MSVFHQLLKKIDAILYETLSRAQYVGGCFPISQATAWILRDHGYDASAVQVAFFDLKRSLTTQTDVFIPHYIVRVDDKIVDLKRRTIALGHNRLKEIQPCVQKDGFYAPSKLPNDLRFNPNLDDIRGDKRDLSLYFLRHEKAVARMILKGRLPKKIPKMSWLRIIKVAYNKFYERHHSKKHIRICARIKKVNEKKTTQTPNVGGSSVLLRLQKS